MNDNKEQYVEMNENELKTLEPIKYKGNTMKWVVYYLQSTLSIVAIMGFTLFAMFLSDNEYLAFLFLSIFIPLMFIDSPKDENYHLISNISDYEDGSPEGWSND